MIRCGLDIENEILSFLQPKDICQYFLTEKRHSKDLVTLPLDHFFESLERTLNRIDESIVSLESLSELFLKAIDRLSSLDDHIDIVSTSKEELIIPMTDICSLLSDFNMLIGPMLDDEMDTIVSLPDFSFAAVSEFLDAAKEFFMLTARFLAVLKKWKDADIGQPYFDYVIKQ